MNRIKELNEKRGAKLKEANALIEKARAEKRELTSAETDTIGNIHTEAEQIAQSVMTEARQLALEGSKPADLTNGEQRDMSRFDLRTYVRHLAGEGSLSGVEAEMAQEGAKEAREAGIPSAGLWIPRVMCRRGSEKRDMSATLGSSTQYGGDVVPTNIGNYYDAFFDAQVLRRGGATVFEGLNGNLKLPLFVAGTAGTGEIELADVDETNPEVDSLELKPKRLGCFVDISDQLSMQSPQAIDVWVKRNIELQHAAVAEAQYFSGTSSTSSPGGIFKASNIGSVVGGTNGAAPDLTDLIDLESKVEIANAAQGTLHHFTNYSVKGKLRKVAKIASTDSKTVWDELLISDPNPLLTNAITKTATKGSVSTCSYWGYGNVRDYIMAYWAGMSVELLRGVAEAKAGKRVMVLSLWHDGGVIRPASFAAMLDVLTA